ncbi:MAG: Gfo/Idh/MocA family oxidoreductase [Pirellulales bacterium]
MSAPRKLSRRRFVQTTSAFLALPLILRRSARGAFAASDRLGLGFIGVGTMGRYHLRSFLGQADVQVVAVCDVVAERLDSARAMVDEHYGKGQDKGTFQGCQAYVDFQELLAREEIDAVVIATPDHWHALPAIAASKASKDVYCEKPLSLTIAEGRAMVQAAAENQVVFQTGSQQRSEFGGKFRDACELIRKGRLGKVRTIRIGVGAPAVPCDLPEEQIPKGTDWDRWLGPAPWRGYNSALCPKGVHSHFPAWRSYREFAGGGLADMGAHHFDIAQWALGMDESGPVGIEPPAEKNAGLRFTYADGVEMFHGGPSGCTFIGEKGTIYVDRGKLESDPAELVSEPLGEDAIRLYRADNHHRNWIECIRDRKPTICTPEIGHRSATICHVANIGYQLRRPLKWDPAAEAFVGDDEAQALVQREMRAPWGEGKG